MAMIFNEALLFAIGTLFGVGFTLSMCFMFFRSYVAEESRRFDEMQASHREDMRTQAQVLLARSSGSVSASPTPGVDKEASDQSRRERELPISMRV
jgi:hypothetical protein